MGKRKSKRTGGSSAMLPALEAAPESKELAAQGWPPVQSTIRIAELMESLGGNNPLQPPPIRAVRLLQGMAGVMAGRLPDSPAREEVLCQLQMVGDFFSVSNLFDSSQQGNRAAGESPEVELAWKLLALAADLLDYLQSEYLPPATMAELSGQTISLSLTPPEFRVVLEHGGLSPDVLAALLPGSAGGPVQLPLAKVAEACYFLALATIGGPPAARTALLAVTERFAKVLDELWSHPRWEADERDSQGASGAVREPRPKRGKARAGKSRDWYQLKITLRGIRPPIWRRIVVPDCSLDDLDGYIRQAMGWHGGHLSCFQIGGEVYSVPSPFEGELLDEGLDARDYRLGEFVREGIKKLRHDYDFGDSWEHEVVVEKTLPPEKAPPTAACLDGARACPPEDCGGVPGYYDLLEALKSPELPENSERLEWVGREWDPEAFNTAAIVF